MTLKRDTSTASVQDSIKRLAMSHDGHPETALHIHNPESLSKTFTGGIVTVMSNAQDDFRSKYDVIRELGKGGFSTVYQCRERATGADFAVKVVDLRPLRLRERFNPIRLRREVDIMKRLHHPNIIQFEAVFEDADHLMMVMEYCPGRELFDVILERKYFSEEDAKPIFAQVARALYYLHALNILHRDVKPENVLVSSIPDREGALVAKLLDFGLSKNAGNGSAAKTFVGTPCYVAPEVEYTSKGLGGTYSFPADCWSLGAVLYVMLVARFPEFEKDASGKVVVKLPPALWSNVSDDAKDLIRGLMNTNPAARLSTGSALKHTWLGRHRATQAELSSVAVGSYDLGQDLQAEEERLEVVERERARAAQAQGQAGQGYDGYGYGPAGMTASGTPVLEQAMVVRTLLPSPLAGGDQQLQLAPLLHLQRCIATCFEEVHASYRDMPDVAAEVRQGASLCRQQLTESTKMLRKVEQTAAAVLGMFPDLELAVEEGEPQLAADFFAMVRDWVAELRELVASTQSINKASMAQVQQIVERSSIGLHKRQKERAAQKSGISVSAQVLAQVLSKLRVGDARLLLGDGSDIKKTVGAMAGAGAGAEGKDDRIDLDANLIMELFSSLFAADGGAGADFDRIYSIDSDSASVMESPPPAQGQAEQGPIKTSSTSSGLSIPSDGGTISAPSASSGSTLGSQSLQVPIVAGREDGTGREGGPGGAMDEGGQDSYDSTLSIDISRDDRDKPPPSSSKRSGPQPMPLLLEAEEESPPEVPRSPGSLGAAHLAEALKKLRQVDQILEQLSVFWANTEVVLDLLTKKGRHVEQFIGFANKPRLMARFRERLEEYKRFWENVSIMCSNYIAGVHSTNPSQRMYGFLEKDISGSVGTPADPGDPRAPSTATNTAGMERMNI
eukprot:CAMPEP_0173274590 /NCGR_PEP_ID=MMETSP1143-20121109/2522_1 /TAXON_ID=483371 /ORGANISM="non described non described, Strain CCMP2298" /LENGTH=901 /DNA_ID=CAMNT_0014211413 /DNA_START=111 /DNA_END=2812 /DNA_ORIENTATION=+